MFAIQVVWFYALMLVVPLAIGGLYFPDRKVVSPVSYFAGLFTAWGAYEILGLPCALLFKTSLTALTVVWSAVTLLLAAVGVYMRMRRARTQGGCALIGRPQLSRTGWLLLAAVVLLLAMQTARIVNGYTISWDDSDYMAQSTTALYTNTINEYEPQTGLHVGILNQVEVHHKISLWGILWASMSQLTGIHPAILCRTLLPVIVFPGCYLLIYLLLKDMFEGDAERSLFGVFFLMVFYEFASGGNGLRQWWLFLYSWYGKTVAAMLVCPFILYLFLLLERETDRLRSRRLWCLMAVTAWAGCTAAASAFLMVPFLLGVLGLGHFIRKRDFLFCVKLGVCIVPCMALYYFFAR